MHFQNKSETNLELVDRTTGMVNWKKKFLHRCISKISFIDTEQISTMQISLQVFFKDFVDRFGTTYLNSRILRSCFSKILVIYLRIATNLKTRLSKKYFWNILFIDSKTSAAKIVHLKVHYQQKILKSFSSIISCLVQSGNLFRQTDRQTDIN